MTSLLLRVVHAPSGTAQRSRRRCGRTRPARRRRRAPSRPRRGELRGGRRGGRDEGTTGQRAVRGEKMCASRDEERRPIAKRVTTRSARIRAARAPPGAGAGVVCRASLRPRRALGGAASSRGRSHLAWRRRARAGANPGDGRRQRRRGQPPERRTRRASRRSYEGRVCLRFRDEGRSDDDPFRVS